MRDSFDRRIARAKDLAESCPSAGEILNFYGHLARFQKSVFDELTVNDETDVRALLPYFPSLLELVRRHGTQKLRAYGELNLADPGSRKRLISEGWEADINRDREDPAARFFTRALLQPYAESLAARACMDFGAAAATCPFCSARPVAAVLRGEGDGAKRWLLCSICSTEWPFRRVVCPNCGEQDKDKLPVYTASGIDHVRVEACESCRTYLKAIDLTRAGLAIPVVDELATVTLNIWADRHGYTKLESNVLGL